MLVDPTRLLSARAPEPPTSALHRSWERVGVILLAALRACALMVGGEHLYHTQCTWPQ